jgi:hypothetical protein
LTGKSKTNFCSFLVQFLTKFNQILINSSLADGKCIQKISYEYVGYFLSYRADRQTHIHTYTHTHIHTYTHRNPECQMIETQNARYLLAEVINIKVHFERGLLWFVKAGKSSSASARSTRLQKKRRRSFIGMK